MKHDATKTAVTTQHAAGLHNDFSEQEESMTSSAMPPEFALTASSAEGNGGMERAEPKRENAPKLHLTGVPPELVTMLAEFEGIKWIVYADTNGHLTGGMGHRIKDDELAAFPKGAAISQAQVEAWAQQDVLGAWNRAKDMSAELGVDDHDFFVAMASMCFQNGLYWNTKHVKTWALMKEHRWEEAAVECVDSDWARQTPTRVPGFQAALRSQAQPSAGGVLHKHARDQKSKAEKMTATKAAMKPKGSDIAVPEGREGMKQVQQKLQALGLYSGKIDGIAKSSKGESQTTKGIKDFQQMYKLPVTGVVDAGTWAKLNGAKAGDDASTWDRFMAKVDEKQKKEASKPKAEGLAAPFTKLAAEAQQKASSQDASDDFVATGNFMGDSNFISQLGSSPYASENNPGGGACRKVATEMLLRYLSNEKPEMLEALGLVNFINDPTSVTDMSAKGNFLRILEEDKSHIQDPDMKEVDHFKIDHWLVDHEQADAAIAYIDGYLKRNIPVLVGVDHTYNRKLQGKTSHASKSGSGYNEGTTDHFITLSGIGKDENGQKYYSFFDPGRTNLSQGSGSNIKNRLVQVSGTRFKAEGTGSNNSEDYHLTMVVLFPADRERFALERENNYSSWID
jgi:lysozyme